MTPREKAVATLEHQDGCIFKADPHESSYGGSCDCYSDQLHVLIAAERGRLRRGHVARTNPCSGCGTFAEFGDAITLPGPCAEPLTPALAWKLLVDCMRADGELYFLPDKLWAWQIHSPYHREHQTRLGDPIEAVARLYLALAEAKWLRRDDAL